MHSPHLFSVFPVILLLFISLSPQLTHAQSKGITISGNDMDITFTERMQNSTALTAITTREGSVDLMLTENFLLIQFSDKGLSQINKKINEDPDDSHFSAVIKSMVSSGVRTLLDRAMTIPLYEISEISYTGEKLIIRNLDGHEIFEDLEFDDNDVMKDFSRSDARQFVATAERLLE